MKFTRAIAMLSLIAALALIAYPLYAHCGKCAADGKKIAAQLDENKMTLAKAVTAAEQHSKGRAITVISSLRDDDQLALHVYCITGDASTSTTTPPTTAKIMKCRVDHKTGKVMGMKEVKSFPITEEDHADDDGHKHGRHDARDHDGGHVAAIAITNQTVDAACGACIYKMDGVTGCPLAVKINGKPYLVEGATWPNHDYCDRDCRAVVTGKLVGDTFIATKLDVKE